MKAAGKPNKITSIILVIASLIIVVGPALRGGSYQLGHAAGQFAGLLVAVAFSGFVLSKILKGDFKERLLRNLAFYLFIGALAISATSYLREKNLDDVTDKIFIIAKDYNSGIKINPETYNKNSNKFEQLPYYSALILSKKQKDQDDFASGLIRMGNFSHEQFLDFAQSKKAFEENEEYKKLLVTVRERHKQTTDELINKVKSLDLKDGEEKDMANGFLKGITDTRTNDELLIIVQTDIMTNAAENFGNLLQFRINLKGDVYLNEKKEITFSDAKESAQFDILANKLGKSLNEIMDMGAKAEAAAAKNVNKINELQGQNAN